MNKDAFYFQHDDNARNDEKIIALRIKYDWKGYGLYWAIIEKLRESKCYKLSVDYNLLSYDLRCDAGIIKSIINDFGLFILTDDGKYFYSKSLCERMKSLDELRAKRSEAGKRGNAKRWGTDRDSSQSDSDPIAKESQPIASIVEIVEIEEDKKKKEESKDQPPKILTPVSEETNLTISECKERLLSNTEYLELVCMKTRINGIESAKDWIIKFFDDLELKGSKTKSVKDAMVHFGNWIPKVINLDLVKPRTNSFYDKAPDKIKQYVKDYTDEELNRICRWTTFRDGTRRASFYNFLLDRFDHEVTGHADSIKLLN